MESTRAAFDFGRSGSLWQRSRAWARGLLGVVPIEPRVNVDAARIDERLRGIASAIVRAPADAYVTMEDGEPALVPDVPGIALDLGNSRVALSARMQALDTEPVTLVTRSVPAFVPAPALAAGLPHAREAVGAPLVLAADEEAWTVTEEDLGRIIAVRPGESGVTIDREPARALVAGLAGRIDRPAADAGLTVDATGAFTDVPQVDAARVEVETTTDAVVDALAAG